MCDKSHESWHTYETPSHTDAHVFNILVEKKREADQVLVNDGYCNSASSSASFGPTGNVVLCDWEMSSCSSKGADVGKVLFFPLICSLCHAVQGHEHASLHILECMDEFWTEYAKCMVEDGGKSDEYLRDTFRDAIGWCGLLIFFLFYHLKMFQDVAPLPNGSTTENEMKQALASCGFVGLRLMEYGFGTRQKPETTLNELVRLYKTLMNDEIEHLLTFRPSGKASSTTSPLLAVAPSGPSRERLVCLRQGDGPSWPSKKRADEVVAFPQ